MEKPERSSYTTLDFRGWDEAGTLTRTPKFQRRDVWSTPAKSYFIDTLITGRPVPPIYLRVSQSADRTRTVREVIDGQQRLNALLRYVTDQFPLSVGLDPLYAGKRFSDLEPPRQDAIRNYSFVCETFAGVSDAEVLEMFARLNTYAVRLNAQELRNGKYFGRFKQCAFRLAFEHVEFWRRNRIFTENGIARMAEVELTSELMIAEIDGLQDKKKSIDDFYSEYDERFAGQSGVESKFRRILDSITDALAENLPSSEFSRPPLFYTLFCALLHRIYGLSRFEPRTPKRRLDAAERSNLLKAVLSLSEIISAARERRTVPRGYLDFVTACLRQTDNIKPRRLRLGTLYKEAFGPHANAK